jgi:hypothetical protein
VTTLAPELLKIKTYLFENLVGLDGFEFVEFASPKPDILKSLLRFLVLTKLHIIA